MIRSEDLKGSVIKILFTHSPTELRQGAVNDDKDVAQRKVKPTEARHAQPNGIVHYGGHGKS